MRITRSQLRDMIIQEAHSMRQHSAEDEILRAVMNVSGNCPVAAGSLLQNLMNKVEMHRHGGAGTPNPATSGEIPQGERLMGDEVQAEEKKVTGYDGPGGAKGILGPGFR